MDEHLKKILDEPKASSIKKKSFRHEIINIRILHGVASDSQIYRPLVTSL